MPSTSIHQERFTQKPEILFGTNTLHLLSHSATCMALWVWGYTFEVLAKTALFIERGKKKVPPAQYITELRFSTTTFISYSQSFHMGHYWYICCRVMHMENCSHLYLIGEIMFWYIRCAVMWSLSCQKISSESCFSEMVTPWNYGVFWVTV